MEILIQEKYEVLFEIELEKAYYKKQSPVYHYHLDFSQLMGKVGIISNSLSQMRKPRQRKVSNLSKVTQMSGGAGKARGEWTHLFPEFMSCCSSHN